MNGRTLSQIQIAAFGLDLCCLNVIFFTAGALFRERFLEGMFMEYALVGFVLNLSWTLSAGLHRLYGQKVLFSFESFVKRTIHVYVYFLLLVMLYLFFYHQIYISRLFSLTVLIAFSIMLVINRFLYLGVIELFRRKGMFASKVLLLGFNEVSRKLATYLERDELNKQIVGYCDSSSAVQYLSNYPIISGLDDAIGVCKEYGVTEIYSTISPEQNPAISGLMDEADRNCIRFKFIPDMNFYVRRLAVIDYIYDLPVISMRREPLETFLNQIKKRMFDIVFSIIVILFLLSWLMPLIALLIRFESKGPIFYLQNRLGKDNKVFRVFKFRSMVTSKKDEFVQAKRNDQRVTRIGQFLRKTSLDELPQFFNVLLGQMSVCGPRPHPLKLNEEYMDVVDKYMVRQFLKPGITGWAQINGYRGETRSVQDMERRVQHDLHYLENWSLLLDLKIVFMTAYNVLRGEENAY